MWLAATQLGYIGIFFGVAIVIGSWIGRWADSRLGSQPWLTMAGLLLGVATGFRELIRIARRYQREEERRDRQDRQEPPKKP